jgi:hypothetical protein
MIEEDAVLNKIIGDWAGRRARLHVDSLERAGGVG